MMSSEAGESLSELEANNDDMPLNLSQSKTDTEANKIQEVEKPRSREASRIAFGDSVPPTQEAIRNVRNEVDEHTRPQEARPREESLTQPQRTS